MAERNNADALNELMDGVDGVEGLNSKINKKLDSSIAASTYATAANLTKVINGTTKVTNATNADSAATATKLSTARSLQVSLSSGAAQTFDGTADKKNIGVTGVLPVANGGTGASSLANITVGAATKASQDGSGNVITTTYATAANLTKVINGTTKVANATNADSAATATKLKTARDIKVNLASTNAGSFDGTASISAGVTGVLPFANGGTGVTSREALMEKLYLAKNISLSNDFKNSAGYRDMNCLTVPGIYEMDSPSNADEAWQNIPTVSRCIIEVFRTNGIQVLQRVTRVAYIAEETLAWRRFGINVGTDEEQWSDWARILTAPGTSGVLPVANGGTGASSLANITVGAATKASQDGSGNVITTTYATAANLTKVINGTTKVTNATNADAATKLSTARKIELSGAVTGSANFDGSANVNIKTVLGDLLPGEKISTNSDYVSDTTSGRYDANKVIKAGLFTISNEELWDNFPEGSNGGTRYLIVLNAFDNFVMQITFHFTGAKYFVRTKTGSTWHNWRQISETGVDGVLAVSRGGTGVTSREALMANLYLAKNITTSDDFKNIVGDRDMDCLTVPGIYEMDSPNSGSEQWLYLPTYDRCIIEVFKTVEKQVIQRVTKLTGVDYPMATWRRFGINVGTDEERWSDWAREVVALNNSGSLNRGINVTQNEDHFVDRVTDRRIDFNYVITPGTYFVNKPNDATVHWENMPWNTQSFSLLEVFELPASDSTSYILQRFTIVNSDNPTMYIRSGTHYITGDVRDIWRAWKKIEATTIS